MQPKNDVRSIQVLDHILVRASPLEQETLKALVLAICDNYAFIHRNRCQDPEVVRLSQLTVKN